MRASFAALVFFSSLLTVPFAKADFLPENDLWQEDRLFRKSGLTETTFNEVVDEVEKTYSRIFKNHGAELIIFRLWSEPTVNAGSAQDDSYWKIWLFGGLARRPELTRDAYQMVICHEIGHHLAGYPFTENLGHDELASEGQADYYSTHVCPRILWRDQDSINAKYAANLDKIPKAMCDRAWSSTKDRNLCYRVMKAGESLSNLDSVLSNIKISWSTPDRRVVKSTNLSYPDGQCRLDTYAAGATCKKVWNSNIIPARNLGSKRNTIDGERASINYVCNQFEGVTFGFRPTCWFKSFIGAGGTASF